MALDNFKKIEDTKGYLVEDKHRKIFESEISKGYFGVSIGDTIEFILYDSSDNPLPQESAKGKTVRYIEYNDDTEKTYFGKSQINKQNIKSNGSEEFFIDTEKLIKEAGYSNGIFKSQVSLLNRRLGSDGRENDTTWIHEISPSRTEIRILPTIDVNGKPNSDLDERYKCLVDGKTFAADVYPLMDEFVEQFNVQTALENMLTIKGTVESGQNYIKLIQQEFKIQNFEVYLTQVKDKFVQAVNHYKNNRDYNILSNRYGQPLQSTPQVCLGTNEIMDTVSTIIGSCIEYYLPKRNVQEETSLTIEQQKTFDKISEVLKTVTSNENYTSTIPPSISAKVIGCKSENALNYNMNADIHDESLCVYRTDDEGPVKLPPPPPPKPVLCNDSTALNFGLEGTCIYPTPNKDTPIEVLGDPPIGDFKINYNTGSGGGKKIICNELYRQGFLSEELWDADERYGEVMFEKDPKLVIGYQMWARKVVKYMRKNPNNTKFAYWLFKPWTEYMGYKMGIVKTPTTKGRFTNWVGTYFSYLIFDLYNGKILLDKYNQVNNKTLSNNTPLTTKGGQYDFR